MARDPARAATPPALDVADLVKRHTHDGGNVLIHNLRNIKDGCRLCRALVAAGVLTLDQIGADTRARISAQATEETPR